MNLQDLLKKEISVIVDGLNRPCGGVVLDVTETLITLKPSTGNHNLIIIPISKIASIMYTDRGTDNGKDPNR
jgi:hypothetical protein